MVVLDIPATSRTGKTPAANTTCKTLTYHSAHSSQRGRDPRLCHGCSLVACPDLTAWAGGVPAAVQLMPGLESIHSGDGHDR